jgi:hypothetical protein
MMAEKWTGGVWQINGTIITNGVSTVKYSKKTNGSYSSFESMVHWAVLSGATKIQCDKVTE